MSEDQFTRLFKYVEKRFDSIDTRLHDTATKKDVDNLRDTVIDFAGNLDTYAQEMAAMSHKIDRLERYIQVIAAKTGVDLDTIHV
ncbi:hypothetical protein KC949_02230 [Candidatus Saccharibacteria bacterium]|nr:hypothetical protein [Candidatus Saccharibacteria bacterium]